MALSPHSNPSTDWQVLAPGSCGTDPTFPGSDPLLAWADGTWFRDFVRPGEPSPSDLPVLCELLDDQDAIVQLARELQDMGGGQIPSAYPRTPGRATAHCTGTFSADYLAAVHRGAAGRMIRRLELQLPVIPRRPSPGPVGVAAPRAGSSQRATAGEVLIGVIDSGCPFAHRSLRHANGGTRLLAMWDLDQASSLKSIGGAAPSAFGNGAEVEREQLNAVMRACTDQDCLDEAACYARAGMTFLRRRTSHGSAVLDLLAGARTLGARIPSTPDEPPRWRDAGDLASRADLVFVDLPRDGVQDSTSGGLGRWLLDGLRYIVGFAGPRTERIVVNLSNGTSRGTHDGASILERALEALVLEQRELRRQLHVVLPAGNDHDEERHAQIDRLSVAGAAAGVKIFVPPGSEAAQWIHVRLPPDVHGVALKLDPPDGTRGSPWVKSGQAIAWTPAGHARALAGIVHSAPADASTAPAVLLTIGATDCAAAAGGAPHGYWTIWVRAMQPVNKPIHLHICRNQRNPGALVRGRQAWFVEAFEKYDPQRWRREAEADPDPSLSPIRRAGSLNGVATGAPGRGVVVVGGVSQREGRPSKYSSAGPAAGGLRQGPDVAAVTDLHRSLLGIVCAGSMSGDAVRMVGTSFASPQVARYLANHGVAPPPGSSPDPGRTGRGGGYG